MKLYVGAAYYPEIWDEAEILKDIQKMKELGVNCVRIGEFAWSTMEKAEGEFDFSVFSRVIDLLDKANISVVLCTPSATPPKWLTDRYPETVAQNDMGVKLQFGARGHACKSSPVMREKNRIIIEKMCHALGNKPNVIGWQIDNEIFPYNSGCFCPNCVAKFREYLSNKYQTIACLNDAWKTARWSLTYSSFDEILPPRKDTWNHPSLSFEWITFQGATIIDYVNEQATELHKHTALPVGTDMMTRGELSHADMTENLDVAQINHYDCTDTYFRSLFWLDYNRTLKDVPFWVTETQPGWFGAHTADGGARVTGSVYNNIYATFIKGGNMHLFWHFRAHPSGQELMHGALIDCAGREYYFTPEIKKAYKEIVNLSSVFNGSKVRSSVAIMHSTTSENMLNVVPMHEGFNYKQAIENVYRGFLGYGVDVISEKADLSKYRVFVTPYLAHIPEYLFEKIIAWVKNGGRWIAGPMTDLFDNTLSRSTKNPFYHLEEISGVRLKYSVPVHHAEYKADWEKGKHLVLGQYYDGYELCGARSLAHYTEGDLKGLSAITEMQVEKGTIALVGSHISADDYVLISGEKPILPASNNLALNIRDGQRKIVTCMEIDGVWGSLELDGDYTELISGSVFSGKLEIEPYGVRLFERRS